MSKTRAPRNRTITLTEKDKKKYLNGILKFHKIIKHAPINQIVQGDIFEAYRLIPSKSVDLLFLDPPYNLSKQFQNNSFNKKNEGNYTQWFKSWFKLILPTHKWIKYRITNI